MPRLKVDGVEIEVPQGATVLRACEAAGWPIQGLIRRFRPELEWRIAERHRPGDALPIMEAAE